jgi:hypothetical protein
MLCFFSADIYVKYRNCMSQDEVRKTIMEMAVRLEVIRFLWWMLDWMTQKYPSSPFAFSYYFENVSWTAQP